MDVLGVLVFRGVHGEGVCGGSILPATIILMDPDQFTIPLLISAISLKPQAISAKLPKVEEPDDKEHLLGPGHIIIPVD